MLTLESLAALTNRFTDELKYPVASFEIQGHRFDSMNSPSLMGVINLSRDSWYRESVSLSAEAAVRRGKQLRAQGAAILDIGAESSLAHAERVDAKGQSGLLLPVVEELSRSGAILSVETYHPEVTKAVLEAGARVINLTGTVDTESIFKLAAAFEAGVILCYVQGENVREVGDFSLESDPIPMMERYFSKKIEEAQRAGVTRIWIDPGLGFYYRNLQDSQVRIQHQMTVFLNSFRLRRLGWPLCHALPHAFETFEEEVRSAEPFFAVLAALGKTDLYRTHEVSKVRAVLETLKLWKN